MNYAIAVRPTPLWKFLSREPYEFLNPTPSSNLLTRVRNGYFDPVALTREQEGLAETFQMLADRWHEEIQLISSLSDITAHPAYQAIVQLGGPVVPFILRELEHRPAPWFTALRIITHQDPVPSDAKGRPHAMAKAWLRWGHQQGLSW